MCHKTCARILQRKAATVTAPPPQQARRAVELTSPQHPQRQRCSPGGSPFASVRITIRLQVHLHTMWGAHTIWGAPRRRQVTRAYHVQEGLNQWQKLLYLLRLLPSPTFTWTVQRQAYWTKVPVARAYELKSSFKFPLCIRYSPFNARVRYFMWNFNG